MAATVRISTTAYLRMCFNAEDETSPARPMSVSSTGTFDYFVGPVDISGDGRFVVWTSLATNLPGNTNGTFDVYIRDRLARETERVSVSSAGVEEPSPSERPAISEDGRFVAFVSHTTNLVPGDTNQSEDVFVVQYAP